MAVAELLRHAIEVKEIRHPQNSASPFVTTSVGAATLFPSPGARVDELIRCADRALYRAKSRGRNCTSIDESARCALPSVGA